MQAFCQDSGKIRYGSRPEARRAADSFRDRGRPRQGGSPRGGVKGRLHAYGCEKCGGFHVGHGKGLPHERG